MKYANDKAEKAFWGSQNFGASLALLEESFNAADLDVEFVCAIGAGEAKIVSIYRDGFLQRQQSIEGDSPAQAVKDVAAGVRL